jgi:hypothetical protein
MKKLLVAMLLSLGLVGCATNDYSIYAKSQATVETAKYNAEAAKYKAMGEIAASGTEAAKVAAVMALALGNQSSNQQTSLQAPQASTALQWAQVLVPGLTQVASIAANMRVGIVQSDNSAKVAVSTNDAFLGMSSKIQAAPTNTTTTNVLSGYGTMGSGSYTTNANPTLSGTGTLGSGTFAPIDRHDTVPVITTPVPSTVLK